MAVDVDDIITKVKDINPRLTSSHDTRILRWINDERRHLMNEGRIRSSNIALTSATAATVADQSLYALPTDFVSIDLLSRKNTDGDYKVCSERDRDTLRIWDADTKTYGANEMYFALRSFHMDIRPTPVTAEVNSTGLRIDYWYDKGDVAASTNVPQFWERYIEILTVGAAIRSGIRLDDIRQGTESHYDNRLFPSFMRTVGPRSDELKSMHDIRSTVTLTKTTGFGRIT